MATQITIGSDGVVRAIWDDRFRPLLEALGTMTVQRSSEVEFDELTGDWVAKLVGTGEEIARGKNRNEVIAQEVKYLEARL
ncbi:MAG: hypothetical protein HY646_17070 [Acidobacteria bacterium]|nr:hypothetical protein [Acidobacteriota bacterium]